MTDTTSIKHYRLHEGRVREIAGDVFLDALPEGEGLVRSADYDRAELALRIVRDHIESGRFNEARACIDSVIGAAS
jgi:hypothetical protein